MMKKRLFSALVVLLNACQMFAQSRSSWEMNFGEGLVSFGFTSPQHGAVVEYDFAMIPAPNDSNWAPAPDPNIINFSQPSTLCGQIDCRQGADFTYFRTFVDIPANVVVTAFTISTSGVDDGIRVTIFNTKFPSGMVVPGSYVFLGGSGTADLKDLVVSGETNTVIITHTDDCCSQSYLQRVDVVLNGQTVRVLDVGIVIAAPHDSSFFCNDSVTVTGAVRISDGEEPFRVTCDVNGIAAGFPTDSTFLARIPLVPGQNDIIAECTVVDALGTTATGRDTVGVFSDLTPPLVTLNFNNLPIITGEAVDHESGIASIEIVQVNNRIVTVAPFTIGDTRVTFSSDKIDPNLRSGFVLRVTNRAGCAILADPVYVRLEPGAGRYTYAFNMPSTDRFLYVNNQGLPKIQILINDRALNLVANKEGTGRSGNTYFIPHEGRRLIDVASYLHEGDNEVFVKCEATASGSADLLFADVQIGEIDNTEILPTAFALNQNYPNPFAANAAFGNAVTHIAFDLPASWTAPVTLRIYNVQGQLIQTLVDGVMPPGRHEIIWNGRDAGGQPLASGVYFYQLTSGEVKAVKKLQMIK